MKGIFRHWATTHVAALTVGLWVGVSLFRLPTFACGPFNNETFASWLSGIGGCLAAIAAFLAARIALQINQANQKASETERCRKARTIATAFLTLMQSIVINVEAWSMMAADKRYPLKAIMQCVEPFSLQPLETLVSKLELFDEQEALLIGRVYGKLSDLVDQVRLNIGNADIWDPEFTMKVQHPLYKKLIDDLKHPCNEAYDALNKFSGENLVEDLKDIATQFFNDCTKELEF